MLGHAVLIDFGDRLTTLAAGAKISYELKPGKAGKMSAENLRVG
jgi:cold shock CspA family protein